MLAMAAVDLELPFPSSSRHRASCEFENHKNVHRLCHANAGLGQQIMGGAPVKRQGTQETKWKLQDNKLNDLGGDNSAQKANANSLLQVCTDIKQLRQIHAHILRNELYRSIFLVSKLVDVYVSCGAMEDARFLFDKIWERNVFLWNVMIRGYAWNGPCEEAVTVYCQMQLAGVQPDKFTFPFLLKACAGLSALQEGKGIHGRMVRIGFDSDVYAGVGLIHMYSKCGSLHDARQVFDKMSIRDVVSWSAMIGGYAQSGHANEALALFHQMERSDMKPNTVTMVSVIQACAQLGDLQQGKRMHDYIIQNGFESNVFVGNSLVSMHAKCGRLEIAQTLFDKMPKRDVVSWNAMIAGYEQNGCANEALTLFKQMQGANVPPNSVTMVSVVQACAHLGALQQGKWVHDYIIHSGLDSQVAVSNSLVTMYAKCGSIEIARQLFDEMPRKNVITWSAMIAGYGINGHGEDALSLFSQMQQTGPEPNHITFVSVLSACSHAGLMDEGWQYFDCMARDYGITPTVEHYACMVDLLGRAGLLDEAQDFVKKMPLEPAASVWGALLGACRIHCNIELGEHVAKRLFDLQPENAGYYVLLSNIYAAAGRWNDVAKVRTMMKDRGVKKTRGCSWVEVNNRVHTFVVGDRSHPQSDKIYEMLDTLAGKMEEAGYVPNTNFVLHDVEEEAKEHMLYSHSEKLAIVFGLINTSPGSPIQITKNLRVCGDCHSATKFISKIVGREIIVRDVNRFHHFKDGLCSCKDYR